MKKQIFVALRTFSEYSNLPLRTLEETSFDIVLNRSGRRLNQSEIVELGRDANGIIAGVEPYDGDVLAKLEKLKCISRCGVGTDNIDLAEAKRKGITVLNTPDAVTQPVAELVIAMIFDLLRLLTFHTNILKKGRWEKRAGWLLSAKKIGIVGLGRIGKRVAEMLKALNADVYGSDLAPDLSWAKSNGIKILSMPEMLKLADIISIHVSISKDNPFILGEKEINTLKKGTIIINTSRGQAIDEKALYEALKAKHLGGAGLDVFSKEPYAGPLKELDNVILTPHIASLTVESRTEMELQAVTNIIGALEGILKT